jgi:catechol 2,3-dioxygenase-like lactoylglutathione lyase family enzyme
VPTSNPVLRELDAVTIPVPDLDSGLSYYVDKLGHPLLWRNDDVGQAGLALPDGNTELVLTTRQQLEPNWRVDSIDDAVAVMIDAGGTLLVEPAPIPVGRVAVVADPFENPFVLVEIAERYPRR